MSEEAFNEIIDNFEVVAYLTEYGRKSIKENVKKLQARIKELEEDLYSANKIAEEYIDSIPVQKVKDKIEEIKEDKNSKYYDMYLSTRDIENTIGILEELLEDK